MENMGPVLLNTFFFILWTRLDGTWAIVVAYIFEITDGKTGSQVKWVGEAENPVVSLLAVGFYSHDGKVLDGELCHLLKR